MKSLKQVIASTEINEGAVIAYIQKAGIALSKVEADYYLTSKDAKIVESHFKPIAQRLKRQAQKDADFHAKMDREAENIRRNFF